MPWIRNVQESDMRTEYSIGCPYTVQNLIKELIDRMIPFNFDYDPGAVGSFYFKIDWESEAQSVVVIDKIMGGGTRRTARLF